MTATLEDIIKKTGGCGRFQITMTTMVQSGKSVLIFTLLFMVFGATVPDWWCVDDFPDTNSSFVYMTNTSGYKSCTSNNGTRACRNFVFGNSTRSVVSEWGLVCGKQWIVSTITSVQMAGLFVGNTVGGHTADAFGRKTSLYGALLAMVVFNTVAIFSPNATMFLVIRFVLGIAVGFYLTVQYYTCELVPAKWRSLVISIPSWYFLMIVFTLFGWILDDWRYMHVVAAVFGVTCLPTWCFVQESFRWKVAHERTEDAFKIVHFIAKVNKMPQPDKQELEDLAEAIKCEEKHMKDRQYSLIDLFRTKPLLKITLPLMMIWFSVGMSLYAIQFAVHALAGNLYVNFLIYSCICIVGGILVTYMQNRFGRIRTFTGWLVVFTLSAVVVGVGSNLEVTPARDMATRICALIAVTCMNTAFQTMQTITLELYPTVVRNIGYGMQNTMARVGAVIGPQLVLLDNIIPGLMYFICAFVGILSILSLRLLPETKGVDLQDRLPMQHSYHDEHVTCGQGHVPEIPTLLGSNQEIQF